MSALLAGLGLGFSAGISPGPLMSLVIMSTLARGFSAGLRVAVAPLLTDVLVITVTLVVIQSLPLWVTGALGLAGGIFVIYLGVEALRVSRHALLRGSGQTSHSGQVDLQRGALVNLLSPHPWMFWLTVGGPLLIASWSQSPMRAAAFLAGFYFLLVGTKIAVAGAIATGRRWLDDRSYRYLLAASGVLLILFGALLLREAALSLLAA